MLGPSTFNAQVEKVCVVGGLESSLPTAADAGDLRRNSNRRSPVRPVAYRTGGLADFGHFIGDIALELHLLGQLSDER